MLRLLALLVLLFLTNQSPIFGEGQKGNFALTMQGGGFGNLEDRFFKSLAFVVSGGLEYYPLNPVSAGILFQFSPKGTFGSPVSLGVGSVSGGGYRRSDRLFQTALFVRSTLSSSSAVRVFGLAGVTWTKVTRRDGLEAVATGSQSTENQAERVGMKFGGGALILLHSNMYLNFTAAYDTRPQKLFSTQAGLTFFFNPFIKKPESSKNF